MKPSSMGNLRGEFSQWIIYVFPWRKRRMLCTVSLMKPFHAPTSLLASASYSVCRHGGAPPELAAVELALPPETAAPLVSTTEGGDGMGRIHDPARAMRERLKILEAREKARAEARAVAEGVAETVGLARRRGAAFEKPPAGRGGRETPYRRQPGLEW